MKLAINDDNGRLTSASSLCGQFELLDLDRDADFTAWLACLSQMNEPFVLFLHCRASTALDRFETIMQHGGWPDLLRGVVIFNSTAFAGLQNDEHVRHEIAKRGLNAAPLHVMRSEVHDNRPQEIIDQVARFSTALRSGGSFASATWHLDAPKGYHAALIFWALNRLVSSEACLASGLPVKTFVLENIEKDALREIASRLGMTLVGGAEQALRDLFEILASQHPFWATELLCTNCSVRQNTRHSLQRKSMSREGLDEMVAEALRMYHEPINPQSLLARRIARSLPLRQSELLVPCVENELGRLYALGCHFSGGLAQKYALEIRDISRDTGAEIASISENLVKTLRCEVHDMIAERPSTLPTEFGTIPPSCESSPRSAV